MLSPIHRLHRFLLERDRELARAGPSRRGVRALVSVVEFVVAVVVEFLDDHCMQMAAALSYSALLALVPISTLFFSIFTAFTAFQQMRKELEGFITEHLFFANEDLRAKVLAYLDQFASNSNQVGIFSVVALIVTVIALMITIENSFNAIWKVPTRRTYLSRVITYSAFVFLAPILLALSFYTTNMTLRRLLVQDLHMSLGLWKLVSGLAISCLMFTLAYLAVPEAKVGLRPALLGGLVAGVLFEWAKWSFDQYVSSSTFYFDVYQTLAIVPIFLIWLYVAWLIALAGLEVAYIYQNRDHLRHYARSVIRNGDVSEVPLVATMWFIARNFHDGRTEANTLEGLSAQLGIPVHRLRNVVAHLEENKFVHRISGAGDRLAPSRPLTQTDLHEVLESLHTDEVLMRAAELEPRTRPIRDAFLRGHEYRRELLERLILSDLAEGEDDEGDP